MTMNPRRGRRRAGHVILSAGVFVGLFQAASPGALAEDENTQEGRIVASSGDVSNLLRATGLDMTNENLRTARKANDTASTDQLRNDAVAGRAFGDFTSSIIRLRLSNSDQVLGDKVKDLIDESSDRGGETSQVRSYIDSLRLADGLLLTDVVDPGLLYERTQRTSEDHTANIVEKSSTDCVQADCEGSISPSSGSVSCANGWRYYARNTLDVDQYFAWTTLRGKTEARKQCLSSPYADLDVVAERVRVKIYNYKWKQYDDGGPPTVACVIDDSRETTGYNTHYVSKTWTYAGHDIDFASKHWTDLDNWHHRSVKLHHTNPCEDPDPYYW